MNIKVQRQKPSKGEGGQGEMRLVMMGRGTFLYIKGGNQWHSLRLSPTTSTSTRARMERGNFQRNVLTIATDDDDHDGTIMPPNSSPSSGEPGLPDAPD